MDTVKAFRLMQVWFAMSLVNAGFFMFDGLFRNAGLGRILDVFSFSEAG